MLQPEVDALEIKAEVIQQSLKLLCVGGVKFRRVVKRGKILGRHTRFALFEPPAINALLCIGAERQQFCQSTAELSLGKPVLVVCQVGEEQGAVWMRELGACSRGVCCSEGNREPLLTTRSRNTKIHSVAFESAVQEDATGEQTTNRENAIAPQLGQIT